MVLEHITTAFTVATLRERIEKGLILFMTNPNAKHYNVTCNGSNLSDGDDLLTFTSDTNLYIELKETFEYGKYFKKPALVT